MNTVLPDKVWLAENMFPPWLEITGSVMRLRVRGVGEPGVCCLSLLMVLAKSREANERLPII
jgi:hypothetical protein